MKILILSLILFYPFKITLASDCPNARLSVVGQEKCKKCAMLISEAPLVDGYRVKLRLVNESTKPIVVYGFKYESGFYPSGYILKQSQDTCKWEYPNGDETAMAWNEMSPEEKSEYLLAAGKSLEIEATFNRFEFGRPLKRTVFVASESGKEPCEIATEEFVVSGNKAQESTTQSIHPCKPNCTLSLAQVPTLHGLKLGMSVREVLAIYPRLKIDPPDKFNVRWASLSVDSKSTYKASLPDVFRIDLHFLRDKLVQIEIQYWALGKSQAKFKAEKIAMLGLANSWHIENEAFECEGFDIRAVDSPLPEIIFTDKSARKILALRVEDSYTQPKKKSKE